MNLPTTLLLTYQIEYETNPDITKEDICNKYSVELKDLKGHQTWTKRTPPPTTTSYTTTSNTNHTNHTSNTSNTSNTNSDIVISAYKEIKEIKDKKELLGDIEYFKQLAVAHAIKFMETDAEYAEVKEVKDVVAIIDSIEKSYKDIKDQGTTVNVLVQNLTSKFSEEDV